MLTNLINNTQYNFWLVNFKAKMNVWKRLKSQFLARERSLETPSHQH